MIVMNRAVSVSELYLDSDGNVTSLSRAHFEILNKWDIRVVMGFASKMSGSLTFLDVFREVSHPLFTVVIPMRSCLYDLKGYFGVPSAYVCVPHRPFFSALPYRNNLLLANQKTLL